MTGGEHKVIRYLTLISFRHEFWLHVFWPWPYLSQAKQGLLLILSLVAAYSLLGLLDARFCCWNWPFHWLKDHSPCGNVPNVPCLLTSFVTIFRTLPSGPWSWDTYHSQIKTKFWLENSWSLTFLGWCKSTCVTNWSVTFWWILTGLPWQRPTC